MLKNIQVGDTERPVPRWALRLAKALPLVVLPHCLWRLPFAFDFQMGTVDPNRPPFVWWATPYVFALSLITESLALLTLGLVSGWGEVFPRWVPFLRGRRVPPRGPLVATVLGGLVLFGLFGLQPLAWIGVFDEVGFSNGWWEALYRVCVGPAMLWGPITIVLGIAYYRRRTRTA
ncbi:hypothetical protein [Kitasatospora sp. NPDC058190]|uniref:hypothetical protein n=1 Tax=Kitasatospora sp. NPDC058190 TaxID=3346371 RepID=UPI0036D92B84